MMVKRWKRKKASWPGDEKIMKKKKKKKCVLTPFVSGCEMDDEGKEKNEYCQCMMFFFFFFRHSEKQATLTS